MALDSKQTTVAQMASRSAIRTCMARVKQYWTNDAWLSPRSLYRRNCISQISRDATPKHSWTPVHRHLSDYIAASSIVHCFDGWSFLGRALHAELAGDPDAARHLGYYAELRAAMSALASEGIGVFKDKHVVVDGNGRCHCLRGGGTHQFTWDALEYWASSSIGVSALQRAIRPGGISLQEWMTHYPGGTKFIVTNWLKQWGLDLARLAEDRRARNLASYRPTTFTSPGPTDVTNTINAVCRLWQMWEPGASGGFPVLDRHLLRFVIETTFKNAHAYRKTRKQAKRKYEDDVTAMLHGVSPPELSSAQWVQFLTFADQPKTPKIFTDANASDGPEHPEHSKQVLARAALLLRVATGSVENLLSEVISPGGDDLRFWWSGAAVRRGLWSEDNDPMTFSDLWQDALEAMHGVQSLLPVHGKPACHFRLWNEQGVAAASLCSAERVALWGLKL